MKKDFIKMLCESEIQNTELALAVEGMSDQLQGMIEKITSLRTKDLSTLVKKIKYDNAIEKAQSFEDSIGQKLDQLISTITEIKGELDNDIVKLFNDETPADENGDGEMSDLESDFGELNSEEDAGTSEDGSDDIEFDDLDSDFGELGREMK